MPVVSNRPRLNPRRTIYARERRGERPLAGPDPDPRSPLDRDTREYLDLLALVDQLPDDVTFTLSAPAARPTPN